jgi:hypothetical protein
MMSSEVVEETSEGIEAKGAAAKGAAAKGAAAKGAEAKGAAAKEPNQCSNCFMSRVTLDMVA